MQALDSTNFYEAIQYCRTCLSPAVSQVLDLGQHPLANSLLDSKDEPEVIVPLVLVRCENCTTVQLSVNVNPELMFQNYLWVTGTTETARKHCQNLAKLIIKKIDKTNVRALEIGSNDGTLLQALAENGVSEIFGVDPASNLQPKHLVGPIRLFEGFFTEELAKDIASEISKVDIVVARNVLSHVPSLNDVMQGIDKIIRNNGIVVIEFHDASKILTELHYESIYHEHTFYHSIKSIQAALSQINFTIFDISSSPISGGSHVIYASREPLDRTPELIAALESEELLGVYQSESWMKFAQEAKKNISAINEIFTSEKDSNWVAFGASARSSTLLNSVGDSSRALRAIADNNPLKQGKYSPGLRIPIVLPKKEIDARVEKVFICAFNFEEEIVNYLTRDLGWHGEVILPLPSFVRRYMI